MIKDQDYNKARQILINAGSMTASKSHKKHTQKKGSPDGHGRSLVREARDEFTAQPGGITTAQQTALDKAEAQMGL